MSGQNTSNPSGIQPTYDKVLVLPQEIKETTGGGLIIPQSVKEKQEFGRQDGTLIATGPAAFQIEGWAADAPRPQVGQRIMFSRYNASEVTGNNGVAYWIMKDTAIMAVLEN